MDDYNIYTFSSSVDLGLLSVIFIAFPDEFPKALHQTFKHMWENVGPGSNWDDSKGVRDSFLTEVRLHHAVPSHYPRANFRFTRRQR